MAPLPTSVGVDTSEFKETALKDLCNLLEGVRGKKTLVVDKSLGGPLGLIAKFSLLKDYGVDQLHWLEDDEVDYTSQKNILYLSRALARNANTIATQIKKAQKIPGLDLDHSIFFVPRRTLVCDKVLEEEGVLGDVTIGEYPLYFIPLESDVLSLELDDSFEDLYLRKTYNSIFHSAKALMQIQGKYGLFPRITGQGDKARRLVDSLQRMRNEIAAEDATNPLALTPSSIIENIIIIDREVDFVTPLLTQLTYEGLIDEVYGVENSHVELDSSLVSAPNTVQNTSTTVGQQQPKKQKVLLDANDNVFKSLRDANYSQVPPLLRKIARRVEADFEKRKDAKTVSEMKQYVSKVLAPAQTDRNSLSMHANVAEQIHKHVNSDLFSKSLEVQQSLVAGYSPSAQHDNLEELIARSAPFNSVLRLLSLYSCISTGFKPKDYDFFRREILQGYGYEHVLTLDNLEKAHLFQNRNLVNSSLSSSSTSSSSTLSLSAASSTSRTNYDSVRKPLKLIYEEINETEPDDIAYVYSGYAPLSIRLVQCVIQKQVLAQTVRGGGAMGWRGFEDVVKYVGGKTIDETQMGEDKAVRAKATLDGQNQKKVTIVFFLGGVTFTEISALRFIGKQEEDRRQIVICTTSIINGNRMMEAAAITPVSIK